MSPCGCPVGTVIEVRNLFFNTPVRHRFLKTASTEKGHIVEAFTRLALANPGIHFVLSNNGKTLHDLPATESWSDRIGEFFGGEIAAGLIPIQSDDAQIQIHGYVCDPSVNRGNARMQYLFLNGRHIRDRSLQHALGEAYRGLLMVGRHPVCFLQLRMPPELIDVNVHPTKLEVRFTDGGRVYSRLLQTLRHHFLSTDMTHRIGPPKPEDRIPADSRDASSATAAMQSNQESLHRQSVIQWARSGVDPGLDPDLDPLAARESGGADAGDNSANRTISPSIGTPAFKPFPGGGRPSSESFQDAREHRDEGPAPGDGESESDAAQPSVCYLGFQVHNRYLVTQDENGMVVIDQHALHERVLYERIKTKVLDSGQQLESQGLLVPEPVSLTPAERTAVLEHRDALAQIGMEIEDFGGDTVVIRSYPAMLKNRQPADMLRTLLESVLGGGKEPAAIELLDHLLSTIACKAAVKAGDPLKPAEIEALLEQKDLFNDTHHCPHGRPTSLFFSRDELDRMFGRMGPRNRSASANTNRAAAPSASVVGKAK